jgi:hypothetical protein
MDWIGQHQNVAHTPCAPFTSVKPFGSAYLQCRRVFTRMWVSRPYVNTGTTLWRRLTSTRRRTNQYTHIGKLADLAELLSGRRLELQGTHCTKQEKTGKRIVRNSVTISRSKVPTNFLTARLSIFNFLGFMQADSSGDRCQRRSRCWILFHTYFFVGPTPTPHYNSVRMAEGLRQRHTLTLSRSTIRTRG